MGIPSSTPNPETPPAGDKANAVITSASAGQAPITATGSVPTNPGEWFGPFNVVFGGSGGPNGSYTATIALDRSFDGGTTWYVCGVGGTGTQAVYSTPNNDINLTVVEVEKGVLYRLRCSAYTSGTINWRFSASGAAATSVGINAGIF